MCGLLACLFVLGLELGLLPFTALDYGSRRRVDQAAYPLSLIRPEPDDVATTAVASGSHLLS